MAGIAIQPPPAAASERAADGTPAALLPSLAGAAVLLALVAPRLVLGPMLALAGLVVALVVAAGVPALRDVAERQRGLVLATVALAAYLALSVVWAPDRGNGLGKVLLFAALAALVAGTSVVAARLSPARYTALGRAVLLALGAGAVFLLIEEATGHVIKSWVFGILPFLKPDARHLYVDADLGERVAAYVTNRNVAMLVLLLWPAAALSDFVMSRARAFAVSLALAAVTALTAILSVHASSRLALIVGVGMYLVARFVPRRAVYLAAAAWLVLTLAMVPIAGQLYARALHLNEKVPFSFRARIILWNYTADKIPERFWRGVGIDGTKPLDAARKKDWETRPGHVYPQRTGEHSHNIYMQVWHELGFIGACLFALFGSALLWSINRLPVETRAAGFAAFLTAAALGATSWGLWQPWFMGAYGLSALVFVIAATRTRQPPAPDVRQPVAPPVAATS